MDFNIKGIESFSKDALGLISGFEDQLNEMKKGMSEEDRAKVEEKMKSYDTAKIKAQVHEGLNGLRAEMNNI